MQIFQDIKTLFRSHDLCKTAVCRTFHIYRFVNEYLQRCCESFQLGQYSSLNTKVANVKRYRGGTVFLDLEIFSPDIGM